MVSETVERKEWLQRRLGIMDAKDRGDAEYLIAALRDPDHRALAARLLGELNVVSAADALVPLLQASDPHVRLAAARVLGELGAREFIPELRKVATNDPEGFVRSWAIGALRSLNDAESVELLLRALHDPSWQARGAAAHALGMLGDKRSLEPVRDARPRLWRSPLEWFIHRRVYNDAIAALKQSSLPPDGRV